MRSAGVSASSGATADDDSAAIRRSRSAAAWTDVAPIALVGRALEREVGLEQDVDVDGELRPPHAHLPQAGGEGAPDLEPELREVLQHLGEGVRRELQEGEGRQRGDRRGPRYAVEHGQLAQALAFADRRIDLGPVELDPRVTGQHDVDVVGTVSLLHDDLSRVPRGHPGTAPGGR